MKNVLIIGFLLSMVMSGVAFADYDTEFDNLKPIFGKRPKISKVEVIYHPENIYLYIHGDHFKNLKYVKIGEYKISNITNFNDDMITAILPADFPAGTYRLLVKNNQHLKSKKVIEVTLGVTGPQGDVGPEGKVGPRGPQGEMGPQGKIGSQGEIGAQGEIGVQGEIGPQGEAGISPEALILLIEELKTVKEQYEKLDKRVKELEEKTLEPLK